MSGSPVWHRPTPQREEPVVGGQRQPRLEVFVSHATKDEAHVALVRQQMEALGISVYLAEHDPQPGKVLAEKVRTAIHRSHAVVVLITTASVSSAYVQQEIGIAHAWGKPIIPIVEKGIAVRQLGILQGVEYLELDMAAPAETLAKMTQRLQPMVLSQLGLNVNVVSVSTTSIDPATAFMLVGLGLIVGVLIAAALSEGGGSWADLPPAVGAVEVAVVGVVVAVRVDEVGVDRAPAAVTKDPSRFAPQGPGGHGLQLGDEPGEVGVGGFVILDGQDEMVANPDLLV
jgi:hypothetical protein